MDDEEERVAIFFSLARLVLPSHFSLLHCYYYYYCRVFFSRLLRWRRMFTPVLLSLIFSLSRL